MGRKHLLTVGVFLYVATHVLGHADDPKVRDRMPRYEGPGWRGVSDDAPPQFSSQNVALLSWISLPEFDPYFDKIVDLGNDCWGYTSPSGREYAIIGLSSGTAFVEITSPANPVIVGVIQGPSSLWRDIKTYRDHAYIVADEGNGGMQVVDMSEIDQGAITLVNTVTFGGMTQNTHNVAINEDSGFLYRCGGGSREGLRIYDLSDPANPQYVESWSERYVHDAQIVTYTTGPYAGREIAFCCGGLNGGNVDTALDILDVTDKKNITLLSRLYYTNPAYSHQAWLSPDRRYLYLDDELDERGDIPTTTYVIDVADLEAPREIGTFNNDSMAIGHNLYTRDDLIFEANYRSGLRVFRAENPEQPVEIAYFDTFPGDDQAYFNGLWSNYPYFPSGTVIGSDMERGLFVWRVERDRLTFEFPGGHPEIVDPNGDTILVNISDAAESLVPESVTMHVDAGAGFEAVGMSHVSDGQFLGVLPATNCGQAVRYYFSAETTVGSHVQFPASETFAFESQAAAFIARTFRDAFEQDRGWTVINRNLADGSWERGVPKGGAFFNTPEFDFDGSGSCYITGNQWLGGDVDGGPTTLVSPTLSLEANQHYRVRFAEWFHSINGQRDMLETYVSTGGRRAGVLVRQTSNTVGEWSTVTFNPWDFVEAASRLIVAFSVQDIGDDSGTEAGIDAFEVIQLACSCSDSVEGPIRDCNGNEIPDGCDVSDGFSVDCNYNNIPDECEQVLCE